MSATSEKSTAAAASGPAGPRANLVLGPALSGDSERTYAAFTALARRPAGLFLAGPFFLEAGEEAELEVDLPDGRTRVTVRVLELVREGEPGMVVALVGDPAACARIDAAIPAA